MKARHHRYKAPPKAHKKGREGASSKPGDRRDPLKGEHPSRVRATDSPIQNSPAVDVPYICSQCGFRDDLPDPDWSDPTIPVWRRHGKKPEECWARCPDRGRKNLAFLTSPDRKAQRLRHQFHVGGAPIFACTPVVVFRRNAAGGYSIGPALNPWQLSREVRIHEYLSRNEPANEIDLQLLYDADNQLRPSECYNHHGVWLLGLRTPIEYDQWARRARKLLREDSRPGMRALLDDLAKALDPRMDVFHPSWNRVLHIPIDLSHPIGEQLDRMKPKLTEIRECLYRFTAQPPPRDRSDTIWRDIYIFLLAEVGRKPVADIGKEVFPAETDKRTRWNKVDFIIRAVRRAAEVAGVTIPPSDPNLSTPPKIRIDPKISDPS